MDNPINRCGLFATPRTYNDLLIWCERHTGSEKTVALTAAHMAINLAHEIVREALTREGARRELAALQNEVL